MESIKLPEEVCEILSLIGPVSDKLYNRQDDGNFLTDECDVLSGNNWEIHSFKRQHQVFTLGDICEPFIIGAPSLLAKRPLKRIYKNGLGMLMVGTDEWTSPAASIRHAGTPMFRTQDGVDLYTGDTFHLVQKATLHTIFDCILFRKRQLPSDTEAWWVFSSKVAAEKFILENKVCLSYLDIKALGLLTDLSSRNKKILINLIKNR